MRAALLLAALAASVTPAPEVIERGGLTLRVPAGWHETAPPRVRHGALTVTLGPRTGAGFELLLTVVPVRRAGMDTRAVVEAAGRKRLATAVETTLSVLELRGEHGAGHYFVLRDRAPAPGEFEHLVQGVVAYGTREVSFTLLAHAGEGPERAAALELLRTARPAAAPPP